MTDIPNLALQEAALKTLADEVADRLKAVKAEMQEALDSTGATRVSAALPDGTKVATVSATEPKPAAVVVDEPAFRAWVRETAATEVVSRVVTEVRPAYAAALLAEMTAAGAPVWADRETGEVHDVPGVEVRATRARGHSVRPVTGGREALIAAFRSGLLGGLALPALAGGIEAGTEAAA